MNKLKSDLRKAAEDLMNPTVIEQNGQRITMGFSKTDWLTKLHTPEHLKIRVVVEAIEPQPRTQE